MQLSKFLLNITLSVLIAMVAVTTSTSAQASDPSEMEKTSPTSALSGNPLEDQSFEELEKQLEEEEKLNRQIQAMIIEEEEKALAAEKQERLKKEEEAKKKAELILKIKNLQDERIRLLNDNAVSSSILPNSNEPPQQSSSLTSSSPLITPSTFDTESASNVEGGVQPPPTLTRSEILLARLKAMQQPQSLVQHPVVSAPQQQNNAPPQPTTYVTIPPLESESYQAATPMVASPEVQTEENLFQLVVNQDDLKRLEKNANTEVRKATEKVNKQIGRWKKKFK